MLRLEPVEPGSADRADRSRRPEHTVFQSTAWLSFLSATQRCRPVVAAVLDGSTPVGWFTGAVVRKLGLPILGSPFPGWSTSYLGFDLDAGTDRGRAAEALVRFAFGPARCVHVEVLDRWLTPDLARAAGFTVEAGSALDGWELDLTPDVDRLFGGLSSSARWGVRKAGRNGVTIDVADLSSAADRRDLAGEYHRQLVEVFARRGRRVPYDRERVESLLGHVGAAGQLVGLRAVATDGTCVATGLFPWDRRAMYFWGGASTALGRSLLANDALLWGAIARARGLGCTAFDFGGGGSFKAKFGGEPLSVPWARRSRWPGLEGARHLAADVIDRGARIRRRR